MKLKEYIEQEDLTVSQFARRVKANPHTIFSIMTGMHDFMASLAIRIERETRGKVKLKELLQEETIQKVGARKKALNTYVNRVEDYEKYTDKN